MVQNHPKFFKMVQNGLIIKRNILSRPWFGPLFLVLLRGTLSCCQTPDFPISPSLTKIWSGSIFGMLFGRLFVWSMYAMSKSPDNTLGMGKQSVTFQWPLCDLSVTFSDLSVTFQWRFGDLSVNFRWPYGDLSVTFRWTFDDLSLIFRWPFSDLWMTFWWPFVELLVTF